MTLTRCHALLQSPRKFHALEGNSGCREGGGEGAEGRTHGERIEGTTKLFVGEGVWCMGRWADSIGSNVEQTKGA